MRMKVFLDPSKFMNISGLKTGVVVAITHEEAYLVVGICACIERNKVIPELEAQDLPSPNWKASVNSILRHYPTDCKAAGIWLSLEGCGQKEVESIVDIMTAKTDLNDAFQSNSTLVVSIPCSSDDVVKTYQLEDTDNTSLELVSIECIRAPILSVSEKLFRCTTMVRVCASFPLYITSPSDDNVEEQISSLVKRVQSPSTIFLICLVRSLFSETSSATVKAALPERFKTAAKQNPMEHGIMAHTQDKPVMVEMLESAEHDCGLPSAPSLRVGPSLKSGCVHMTVPIDVLGLVEWESTLGEVAAGLKERICAQLEAMRDEILWKADTLHSVSIHHFTLEQQECPVTLIYPDMPLAQRGEEEGLAKSLTNSELHPRRSIWKKFFGLPNKSSHLRVLSRNSVGGSGSGSNWIASKNVQFRGSQPLNPHLAVKRTTRVKGGNLALVQGNYLYYHYRQEGFNDKGWGCAYRSLQTLWSWFLLQLYTDKEVPGHRQIQETLIAVGDKEKKFIGSEEWIGSFEVSTVLNECLGIQSKIQYCSSGKDMASIGRVLLSHFKTEGTPVMIGGGVLAHTILGVDFNESTGDMEFLILDPHHLRKDYTKIKEWCRWEQLSFWVKDVHYNMCLPQLPSEDHP